MVHEGGEKKRKGVLDELEGGGGSRTERRVGVKKKKKKKQKKLRGLHPPKHLGLTKRSGIC